LAWFSFHGGHSGAYCRHAKGRLGDVVRRAVELGFTHYGMSEHCPRWRAADRFADELDLAPEDLVRMFDDYVAEACQLQDTWSDRIELFLGFETEVLPPDRWVDAMTGLRATLPRCDYVIGSVHHVEGMVIDYKPELARQAADAVGGQQALELAYFELVARVATELRPEILGHIDLIRKFAGPDPQFDASVRAAIERALEAARASGSALDVNAAPARRGFGPIYPLPWILARACAMGIPVTLGDDGHGPHDVGVGLDACVAAIAAAGYREIHCLTRAGDTVVLAPIPIDDVRPQATPGLAPFV
jgi:histidinol-phosphatase (PHP family)